MNLKKTLFTVITVCIALAGCTEKQHDATILKPIDRNLLGKWEITKFMTFSDGKWTETPGNVIISFAADGSVYHIYPITEKTISPISGDTTSIKISVINKDVWKVDEERNMLSFDNMASGEIFKLDVNEFEWGKPTSMSDGKQTMKYVAVRKDEAEKCIIEKMLGKWNYTGSYEKNNGEWKSSESEGADESTMEFRIDGTMTLYVRFGERESTIEGNWGVIKETNELYIKSPNLGWASNSVIEMEDSETMVMKYFLSTNWLTGERKKGEFKDVYKLSK